MLIFPWRIELVYPQLTSPRLTLQLDIPCSGTTALAAADGSKSTIILQRNEYFTDAEAIFTLRRRRHHIPRAVLQKITFQDFGKHNTKPEPSVMKVQHIQFSEREDPALNVTRVRRDSH
jgi:hypothetical protein